MSIVTATRRRAIVVHFRDLHRWSVGSFVETGWRWPADIVQPLSSALRRKVIDVDRAQTSDHAIRLVTLHFDGEMEPRGAVAGDSIKGRLYFADPGDVVYSKIDVRNGAIGIVPNDLGRVCVTSEYPVYSVDPHVADAHFVKLLFRTDLFRRKINSMITGASGRKRVQPSELESVAVPFPSLSVQRKIVTAWESARERAAATAAKIEQLERGIEVRFLADLGLKAPEQTSRPKAFAVQWQDFLRWSVSYNQLAQAGIDITRSKHSVVEVGSLSELIQYGTSEKANTAGDGTTVIRMNNLIEGELDLRNLKHVRLTEAETRRLTLLNGDILFNRTNSKELVGKCAVFHEEGQYVFASYLIRVRVDTDRASPDFVAFALNSPIGRQQIDALSRQIIGQANINSEELRSLRIPLPPLAVQHSIMNRVTACRAEIAKLKADAQAHAEAAKADVEAMILGTKPVE